MKRKALFAVLFSSVIGLCLDVQAEPISVTFTLTPGWNSVFLQVEPENSNPSEVFSDIADLVSVWKWNPNAGAVEFIQDPSEITSASSGYLVYFPPPDPQHPDVPHILTNLHAIHGNSGYLIHLGGSVDVPLTATGEPLTPDIDWVPNSFNLVGFSLEDPCQK